jgi:hypothetical protein
MIDSISFRVPGGRAPDLENVKAYREDYFRGTLGNMRITQYPDGAYCTGSLATYLQGSNVLPLTRRTVVDALRKLETETGWDLKKVELNQIEIGTTLQVQNPPCLYLASWGNMPRFVKQTYQKKELETVTYFTGARSFTGYDKRKQGESTGQEIPAIFSGAELIRLELKYKQGLKARLGRSLTPWDLADRATYTELVKQWQAFYFRIPKGRVPVLDVTGGISPKDLDNALKGYGLQALGYDTYSGIISLLERRGNLGRVQAGRAREAARNIAADNRISQAEGLTAELDARVREVATYAR